MYFMIKALHILSACVVIGYLVYDVFIFSTFKNNRTQEEFKRLKREILKPSALIMGCGFCLLIISGICLATYHMGGELGLMQTNFQKILWLKIALVSTLFIFTPFSLYFVVILHKKDPFREYYHHIALVICVLAVGIIEFGK